MPFVVLDPPAGPLDSTLEIYRAAVRARGYDGASNTEIDSAIQAARKELLSKRRWSYALAQTSDVLTAGTDTIDVVAAIGDLGAIDGLRYRNGATEYDLDPIDYQQLRDYQSNDATTATGLPSHWARRGDNVVLYPTPNAAYELVVDYIRSDGDLLAGARDYIPGFDRELVVWAAIVRLAFRQREAWAMQYAEEQFKGLLRSALDRDAKQARQDSDQVKPYWGSNYRTVR